MFVKSQETLQSSIDTWAHTLERTKQCIQYNGAYCLRKTLMLPGLGFFKNLRAGGGLVAPRWKNILCLRKFFIHFTWNFVHMLHWQYELSLDKKIDKCHFGGRKYF